MDIFTGQNLLEFADRFKTNEDCKVYLAEIKWKDGFNCVKCGIKDFRLEKIFREPATSVLIRNRRPQTPFSTR